MHNVCGKKYELQVYTYGQKNVGVVVQEHGSN